MRLPAKRRDRLQIAIVINQLATPGLGSWMVGYRIAGAGQLALALAGFFLMLGLLIRMITDAVGSLSTGAEPAPISAANWKYALILFGVAWIWSGFTSLQMLAEIRRLHHSPDAAPQDSPPRLP